MRCGKGTYSKNTNFKDFVLNDKFLLNEELKTYCCVFSIKKNSIITLVKFHTKNRVYIEDYCRGIHKVKLSSIRRIGTKLKKE